MGRPTKLTPALQKKIVALVRKGVFASVAARACGITERTFFSWMADGRELASKEGKLDARERSLVQFFHAIEQARAEAEAEATQIVVESYLDGDINSAKWFLERVASERFSPTTRSKIEAAVEHKQEKPVSELSDDELLEYLSKHGLGEE